MNQLNENPLEEVTVEAMFGHSRPKVAQSHLVFQAKKKSALKISFIQLTALQRISPNIKKCIKERTATTFLANKDSASTTGTQTP
jgi:hypothetical protein